MKEESENKTLKSNNFGLLSAFEVSPTDPRMSWGAPMGNGAMWGKFTNPGYVSPGTGPSNSKSKHKPHKPVHHKKIDYSFEKIIKD